MHQNIKVAGGNRKLLPRFLIERLEGRQLLSITTTHPYPGVTIIHETTTVVNPDTQTNQTEDIHIAEIDLATAGLGVQSTSKDVTTPVAQRKDTIGQTTLNYLIASNAQLAINGNFFTPVFHSPNPVDLLGFASSLTVSDAQNGLGATVVSGYQSTNIPTYAVMPNAPAINIAPNHIASVLHYDPANPALPLEVNNGSVQLGNSLSGSAQIIINNTSNPDIELAQYHDWYHLVTSRTAMGISQDGTKLVMLTVDHSANSQGMSVPQVIDKFLGLSAPYTVYNAINLDGGGSTSMAMQDPATGSRGLINVSSDPTRTLGNNITFFAPAPAAPLSLAATSVNGSGNSTITWSSGYANTNYGDSDKITIERSTDNINWTTITSTALANALTYTASGLLQNTRYYFRAKVSNAAFASPSAYSNTAVIDYVPAPSNLSASIINGSGQSTLTWSGNYGAPDTMYLDWYNETNFTWPNATVVPAANGTGVMEGLDPHFTYQARAHAHSSFGNDSPFAYTTVSPSLVPRNPINLTASEVNQYGYSTLHWQGSYWGGDAVHEEQSSNGINFTEVHVSAAKYLGDSIFGLSQNTQYYLRIRVSNSVGNSAYSNVVHIGPQLPTPPTPTSLTADAISNSTSVLHWQGTGWTNYDVLHVYESTDGINFIDVTTTSPVYLNDNVYNLTAGQTYYFKVRVVNQSGIWSDFSNVAITS